MSRGAWASDILQPTPLSDGHREFWAVWTAAVRAGYISTRSCHGNCVHVMQTIRPSLFKCNDMYTVVTAVSGESFFYQTDTNSIEVSILDQTEPPLRPRPVFDFHEHCATSLLLCAHVL